MNVRDREDLVVARLHDVASHLDGEPDSAWQATTRARLVAMAAVRSPAAEPVSPWRGLLSRALPSRALLSRVEDAAPSRWRGRLTAGLAGAAIAVTALAALVAVSTGAGPGDPLYGLKRGTEQTQLALAGDGRGQALLEFARTRLHELEELAGSRVSALPAAGSASSDGTAVLAADADPQLVLETLATMDAQTTEGAAFLNHRAVDTGDDVPLELLAAWSEEQSAGLTALREELPDSTVDELDGSLARLTEIRTRTVALTDVLGCAAGVPVEATDRFGPVPGLCLPGEETPPAAGEPSPTGTAAVPTGEAPGEGTSTGGPQPGGEGSGEGGGPTVPSAEVPSGGGVPTVPTLPSVPLPSVPLPSVGLPGASTGSSSTSSPTSTPALPLDIDVCLGALVLGSCSD